MKKRESEINNCVSNYLRRGGGKVLGVRKSITLHSFRKLKTEINKISNFLHLPHSTPKYFVAINKLILTYFMWSEGTVGFLYFLLLLMTTTTVLEVYICNRIDWKCCRIALIGCPLMPKHCLLLCIHAVLLSK